MEALSWLNYNYTSGDGSKCAEKRYHSEYITFDVDS